MTQDTPQPHTLPNQDVVHSPGVFETKSKRKADVHARAKSRGARGAHRSVPGVPPRDKPQFRVAFLRLFLECCGSAPEWTNLPPQLPGGS